MAPSCDVQCRFCNRSYPCVNESRPGVTAEVMAPREALEHLERRMERIPNISLVGIAGPGDPFANPDETLETLRLVREAFPELMPCVSSNGLNAMPYVDDVKRPGVSRVTITVNAVHPGIGALIYDHVEWGGEVLRGAAAAQILYEYRKMAVQALDFRGVRVKVNTVCIPGVNDLHIEEISRAVAVWGAGLHNVIPLIPAAGAAGLLGRDCRAEALR